MSSLHLSNKDEYKGICVYADIEKSCAAVTLGRLAADIFSLLLMLLFFRFGWAKPVPVNPNGFTRMGRKKGMLLVAIAGPAIAEAIDPIVSPEPPTVTTALVRNPI